MPDDTIIITSYEGLVHAGREAQAAADDVQWTEGDLALQVEALTGNTRPRDEQGNFIAGEGALKRYADDIEVNYSSLQDFRRVASAWPPPRRRGGVSWAAHRELASVTDRFDHIRDGMTVREARELSRELRGMNTSTGRVGPGWFELLGEVGDSLIKAGKQLDRAEAAIEDPGDDLRAKAEQYAGWADDLARRLRAVA